MRTNDRVRKMVRPDLGGEEALAVVRLQRAALEGRASATGVVSTDSRGDDVEAALLARHGFDAGKMLGQGQGERQDLLGCWLTVTPTRLVVHAPDTGFWVLRPRPAELRRTIDRDELVGVEHVDHDGRAIVFRCWLLRFADGTWSLQHTMVGGTLRKKAFDDEGDLAAEALGSVAVASRQG